MHIAVSEPKICYILPISGRHLHVDVTFAIADDLQDYCGPVIVSVHARCWTNNIQPQPIISGHASAASYGQELLLSGIVIGWWKWIDKAWIKGIPAAEVAVQTRYFPTSEQFWAPARLSNTR